MIVMKLLITIDNKPLTEKEIKIITELIGYGFDSIVEDLSEIEENKYREVIEKLVPNV